MIFKNFLIHPGANLRALVICQGQFHPMEDDVYGKHLRSHFFASGRLDGQLVFLAQSKSPHESLQIPVQRPP